MIFEYIGLRWKLNASKVCYHFFSSILDDYFKKSTNQTNEKLDFKVTLFENKYPDIMEIIEYGKEVVIHNSKKPDVHEVGYCYQDGFISTFYNKSSKSVYKINYLSNNIEIYNADVVSLSKDYVRVVRDIVKVSIEEKHEAMLVHAASLRSPSGQGILMIGGKKSGKTSISLELLFKHGFTEISRDRTFLLMNQSEIKMYGWPNYYNLTMDTMKKFNEINHLMPDKYRELDINTLEKMKEKKQFLPEELNIRSKDSSCQLGKVFFLVENEETCIWDHLGRNLYTPYDLNYPNWHQWGKGKEDLSYKTKKNVQLLISHSNIVILPKEDTLQNRVYKLLKNLEEQ